MKLVEKEIIIPLSDSKSLISDNERKFDCKSVHDFTKRTTPNSDTHQRITHRITASQKE